VAQHEDHRLPHGRQRRSTVARVLRTFLRDAQATGAHRGLSLSLIDSDGDYEPGNVQWIAPAAHARRDNVFIEAYEQSFIAAEWAESEYVGDGVTAAPISQRIRYGWEPERAIATPVKVYRPRASKVSA
jgi:hypothetical protein